MLTVCSYHLCDAYEKTTFNISCSLLQPADPIQTTPQPQMGPQVVMVPGAPGMYPTFAPTYQIPAQPMMVQPMPMVSWLCIQLSTLDTRYFLEAK